jgi:hypothetical protein
MEIKNENENRHDLQVSSCLNKETDVFNRKVQKIMNANRNVNVVHTNLSRSDFTRHGMHLMFPVEKRWLYS